MGQATAGAIAFGAVGIVAGMIGSSDSRLVCLGCGHKWTLPKPQSIKQVQPYGIQPRQVKPSISKPAKRLESPYVFRNEIGKYRCEYCFQSGRYHYCKTLKGIERHIKDAHSAS